jgi:RPC5 protein
MLEVDYAMPVNDYSRVDVVRAGDTYQHITLRGQRILPKANYAVGMVQNSRSTPNPTPLCPFHPFVIPAQLLHIITPSPLLSSPLLSSPLLSSPLLCSHLTDKVYLTPVTSTIQMRPVSKVAGAHGDEDMDGKSKVKAPEVRALLQAEKVKTERQLAIQRQSYQTFRENVENEEWVQLEYQGPNSDAATNARKRALASTSNVITDPLAADTYLSMLGGSHTVDTGVTENDRNAIAKEISQRRKKKTNALPSFVTEQLKLNHVIPFDRLCEKIGSPHQSSTHAKALIECLEAIAWCVNGLWVIRSKVIYGDTREALARDFLLGTFARGKPVIRSEFVKLTRLGIEVTESILGELADHAPNGVQGEWKFRFSPDDSFLDQFPNVCARMQRRLEIASKFSEWILGQKSAPTEYKTELPAGAQKRLREFANRMLADAGVASVTDCFQELANSLRPNDALSNAQRDDVTVALQHVGFCVSGEAYISRHWGDNVRSRTAQLMASLLADGSHVDSESVKLALADNMGGIMNAPLDTIYRNAVDILRKIATSSTSSGPWTLRQ